MDNPNNARKYVKPNSLGSQASSSEKSNNNRKKMEEIIWAKLSCLEKIRNILSLNGHEAILNILSLNGDGDLKLLLFFMTLGTFRGNPCTIVITGQTLMRRSNLVKSVTRLYPENYVYTNSETGATCRKSLIHRNWILERILFLTNFEGNIRLIRRFVNDEWIFTEVLREVENLFVNEIKIPKMTVISTATKLDEEIGENSFVIRLRYAIPESRTRSEYSADLSSELNKKLIDAKKNDILLTEIREFLLNLDKSLRVEIPYVNIVKKCFRYGLPKSELYHHFFLELIKNIAFYHQSGRDRYQIKGEDITILLANLKDFELALNLGHEIFTIAQQDLQEKYIQFYKFIIDWVEGGCRDKREKERDSKDKENFGITDFSTYSFTRSQLISDFREEEMMKHGVVRTHRTYENYIDYLVNTGYLELRERRSNENLYRIKNSPSLITVDLFERNWRTEVKTCIDQRKNNLIENSNVKFIAINEECRETAL